MKVLLSIKPEYASRIFDGSKHFEYRRVIFCRQDVKRVVVYASRPVGKVVGEFEVGGVLSGTPLSIWRRTEAHAGISRKEFFRYFSGTAIAHAIRVANHVRYDTPLCLQESFRLSPPQSFLYLAGD